MIYKSVSIHHKLSPSPHWNGKKCHHDNLYIGCIEGCPVFKLQHLLLWEGCHNENVSHTVLQYTWLQPPMFHPPLFQNQSLEWKGCQDNCLVITNSVEFKFTIYKSGFSNHLSSNGIPDSKDPRSKSIRYWSDTFAQDRYLIYVDLRAFAIRIVPWNMHSVLLCFVLLWLC